MTIGGTTIESENIGRIKIVETDERKRGDTEFIYLFDANEQSERDVTDEYIVGPPGNNRLVAQAASKSSTALCGYKGCFCCARQE